MTTLKLSPQAVGALMMAVQKGTYAAMMNKPKKECDITQMLLDFELEETTEGLMVLNPPTVDFDFDLGEDIEVDDDMGDED